MGSVYASRHQHFSLRGRLPTCDVQCIYFDALQQRDKIMWPYATRRARTSLARESDTFELAETVRSCGAPLLDRMFAEPRRTKANLWPLAVKTQRKSQSTRFHTIWQG
jgi:hypothetical protein